MWIEKSRKKGFTLVELMVVIAILGVLAAVALPSYNNYTTKSKFAEVVLATNPTKQAVNVCAGTGDCVVNGALSLGTPGSAASVVAGAQASAASESDALIYAFTYAYMLSKGYSTSQAQSYAQQFVTNQDAAVSSGSSSTRFVTAMADGQNACMLTLAYDASYCSTNSDSIMHLPTSTVNAYLNSSVNPYYAASVTSGTAPNLPCVGSTAGCSPSTKYVSSVGVSSSGVITATATSSSGLNAETFTLTPSYSSGRVDWSSSGTCKTRSAGAIC